MGGCYRLKIWFSINLFFKKTTELTAFVPTLAPFHVLILIRHAVCSKPGGWLMELLTALLPHPSGHVIISSSSCSISCLSLSLQSHDTDLSQVAVIIKMP